MKPKPKEPTVTPSPPYNTSELYQILFEQAGDGIFVTDAQGRYLEVNQRGCELLGYSSQEILGLTLQEVILIEDQGHDPLRFEELQAGKTVLTECWLRCKDGCLLPVEINARILSNDYLLSTVRDISQRKQTERELQQSHDLLRAIIEAAPTAIIGLDLDGNVQMVWNPAAENMLGWKAEEVMGRPLPSVPVENQEEFRRFRERIRGGLTLNGVPVQRQRRDGSLIDYSIYASPLHDAKDQISGNIAVLVDITERKQLERQLLESEQRFRLLSESALTGIYLIQDNYFRYVNPAMVSMFGYTVEELVDQRGPLDLVYPDDRHIVADNIRRRVEGEAAEIHYDFRGLRKDGSIVHIEVHGRRIEYGGKIGVLGSLVDITERKKAEMQVQANEQLFRALVENSPDYVSRYDRDFRRIYVNPALQKLFGKTAEHLLNATPADESPIYTRQIYLDQLQQVIETATERAIEIQFRTSLGEMHWGHIRFAPEFGPDGQVVSVLAIGRDIHEIKQAEAERQAHLRFLTSMDQANRAIQGANDLEHMMRDVLDVLLAIFECDRAWLVHPCDPEAATWQTPMERTRPEYPGVLPVGVELPLDPVGAAVFQILRDNAAPVTFEPESPHQVPEVMTQIFQVQSFIAVALYPKVGKPWSFGLHQCSYPRVWSPEDQRLFQEIARRLTDGLTSLLVYRNLEESETRFRTLVNHAADAFYLHGPEGTVLDVNRQACESLGYSREELIGMTPFDFDVSSDRSWLDQMDARLNAGEVIEIETWHRRKDGSVFPVEVRIRPFWQGERRFAVSLARDITERKRVEEALRESEFFLRKSQAAARLGSYYFDARTGHWISSPALDVIFGIDERFPKDIIGWIELVHPEHKDEMIQYLTQQVMTEHHRFDKEYRIIRHNDQQERWMHGLGELEFDEYGNAIKMIGTIQDITERKAAEKALQLTRFTMESVADAVYWINPEAGIIEVNKAACEMLGYTHDELCRLSLADIDPGFSIAQWSQAWENIRTVGRNMIESRHRTKTGRLIPVEIIANFIKFGGQELDCAVVRDITERKRAEETLRESEQKYRTLVERANDGIVILQDGIIQYANPRLLEVRGGTPEEVIGTPFTDHLSTQDLPALLERYQRWMAGEDISSIYETMLQRQDGAVIPVEINAALITYQNKPAILVLLHDLTERKKAEQALRESEERLRQIASSLREVIWLRDVQTRQVLYVNPAFEELTGRTCESLYENRDIVIDVIHPDDKDWVIKALDQRFEDVPFNKEHRIIHLDGSMRWVWSRIFPVRNEAGEVYRWASIMENITERKQAEEKILQFNQELEQRVLDRTAQLEVANKELEAFAYSVSHDLRAPLRHIDGFLELLQKRTTPSLDERSRHYMTTIADSARRMGQLIDDLLSFSRMGRNEMIQRPVDLAALVQEVIRQLEPETQDRTFHWDIADLPTVNGDQAMLRVVLINLITNAVKFTRGRSQAKIEIGCQTGEKELVIFVRDNGAGFEMAYADKLFGVFQRLHRADEFEGTGIGLANVRRIIQRHGGRVWAEGKVNQGATFYFSLPQKEYLR